MSEKNNTQLVLQQKIKKVISETDIIDYKTSIKKSFYFDVVDVLCHIIRGFNSVFTGDCFTTSRVEIRQACNIYNAFYLKEITMQEAKDQAFLTGQMNLIMTTSERSF